MWCMIISVTSKSFVAVSSPSEAADKVPTAIHINSPVKRKKALMHKQLKNQTGIRTCLGHYTQPRPVRFKKMAGKHLPGYSPNSFWQPRQTQDRKSTRLNSSHVRISYAVFCMKKKT